MKEYHEQYQRKRGWKDRYDMIRPVLDRFKRPFSMIDIGASTGSFCVQAMKDYQCTAIAIEKEDIVPKELICIRKRVSGAELVELAVSEHFDVVLGLSVLHHASDWSEFLRGLFSLGDHVILEYPTPSDVKCKHRDRMLEQYELLRSSSQHYLGITDGFESGQRFVSLFEGNKPEVHSGAFYDRMIRKVPHRKKPHSVVCDYDTKTVDGRPWIHGINLWSFLQLGGGRPSRLQLSTMLNYYDGHGDIRPWNYILNYDGLHLFDPAPPYRKYHPDDAKAFQETVDYVRHGGDIS